MKKIYLLLSLITTGAFAQGSLCTDPIVITSLPYSTTDNTSNYGDNYDPQITTSPTCSTTTYGNNYHIGNDVIYSYTPAESGTIKVELPNAVGWSGLFIYTDCANIGVAYAACATGVSTGNRTINNFAVTAGQTYYFFLSTWASPQTMAYTLNVTQVSLGVDDLESNSKLALYPNPVSSTLFLETNQVIKEASVFSINGQLIGKKAVTENAVNVSELQSGFYMIELTNEEGVKTFRKFVKS